MRVLDPCDAGAGQLRSAHHLEDPPDLLADHDGGDALALDRAHDLGGAGGPVVDRHQVHRTGAGERDLDQPAASGGAVLFTTMVDDGGASIVVGERAGARHG